MALEQTDGKHGIVLGIGGVKVSVGDVILTAEAVPNHNINQQHL